MEQKDKLIVQVLLSVAGSIGLAFLAVLAYLNAWVFNLVGNLDRNTAVIMEQIQMLRKTDDVTAVQLEEFKHKIESNSEKLTQVKELILRNTREQEQEK